MISKAVLAERRAHRKSQSWQIFAKRKAISVSQVQSSEATYKHHLVDGLPTERLQKFMTGQKFATLDAETLYALPQTNPLQEARTLWCFIMTTCT